MTEKGYEVLKCLVANDHTANIESVVIAADKNVVNDYTDEIAALCKQNNITVTDKRSETTLPVGVKQLAIGWRWLINSPANDLIVIHDSILPKYRGFAPLVTQLINGEKKIGATMLYASAEYDKGDIIQQISKDITYPITIAAAIKLVCSVYCELAMTLFNSIKDKKELVAKPQDHSNASYSLWRNEDDYHINWNDDAATIRRFVDACGEPYLGAFALMNDEKIRVISCEEVTDVHIEIRQPGKIIFMENKLPVVVCGKGLLVITAAETYDSKENILPLKNFRVHFR